jgi:hypothetical protein
VSAVILGIFRGAQHGGSILLDLILLDLILLDLILLDLILLDLILLEFGWLDYQLAGFAWIRCASYCFCS